MVIGFQPGGTIKNVRIVLRWQEKLPRKYNTEEAEVYMEGEHSPLPWTLMKPLGALLPEEHLVPLTAAEIQTDILDLTVPAETATFDHVDIIRMDDDE